VIRLTDSPQLVRPTREVRVSYLVGEQADCLLRGTPTQWLEAASDDFAGFVAARRAVQVRWGVPSTVFWYVSGEYYLGTLVVRHRLTPVLAETGGHIGYHVVAPWRRQGHATRMLTAGLAECRRLGLDRVLLTCATDNEPSRRVSSPTTAYRTARRTAKTASGSTLAAISARSQCPPQPPSRRSGQPRRTAVRGRLVVSRCGDALAGG
jgi:predicted acetyltransferase